MTRLLAFFLLVISVSPGIAETWTIKLRDGPVNTCYATRELPDGSVIEIGFAPERARGYFAIYNADWTHIEDGREGVVEFDFGTARFAGETVGRVENGFPGGYAVFNNPAFLDAFARRQTVKIIGTEGAEFALDLTGTNDAIAQIRECQSQQDSKTE